jgi:hypothetical protein
VHNRSAAIATRLLAWVIGTLVGISMIFTGTTRLMLALAARRAPHNAACVRGLEAPDGRGAQNGLLHGGALRALKF